MLTIKRNHAKPPPGGHRFESGKIKIAGSDPDDVIERMIDYRAENGLPLGWPEHELAQFYKKIAPWLVRDTATIVGKEPSQETAEKSMVAITSVPALLSAFSPDVKTRNDACAKCAFCSKEIIPDSRYEKASERKLDALLGERGSWAFGVCSFALLPVRFICRSTIPLQSMPECCWMKKQ
jgi:hypothetical protein